MSAQTRDVEPRAVTSTPAHLFSSAVFHHGEYVFPRKRVPAACPDKRYYHRATLVVEGKDIHVNRGLLTVCSPALSKKFPAGTNNLELNDEKYDQMFLLVQQLIPENIVSTPVEGEPP